MNNARLYYSCGRWSPFAYGPVDAFVLWTGGPGYGPIGWYWVVCARNGKALAQGAAAYPQRACAEAERWISANDQERPCLQP